ncbi:MAG: hypothetical protein ACE5J2_05540 [Nitrososphaerales archaeon]
MPFWFGKGRKKSAAKDVVRNWEKSQGSNIAKELVRIIPDKVPFLRDVASSSLAGIINKNLSFSALEPEEVSGNLYKVVDTVHIKVGAGIPLIGKQFSVSINYKIDVDVKAKKIVEAKPDITSLKFDLI